MPLLLIALLFILWAVGFIPLWLLVVLAVVAALWAATMAPSWRVGYTGRRRYWY